MTVSTRCTSCGKTIELADKWDGQIYTCPACQKPFTVRDQSTMPDWSMIVNEARQSAGKSPGASAGGSRLGAAIAGVPHSAFHGTEPPPLPTHRTVKMDLGMGDESAVATGLIFLGYGAALVLQLVDLSHNGMLAKMGLLHWLLLGSLWLAMFATVAPITNIGMQLAAKILGQSFGPTLFRMYGLLAIPPAMGLLGMAYFGQLGVLIGMLIGLLLLAPAMWLMFGLGATNTLVAFLMSAVFFVIGIAVYIGVAFLLMLIFGLMGLALADKPDVAARDPFGVGTRPGQVDPQGRSDYGVRDDPLFNQPRFTAPPPPRHVEQKQYTLLDSTDAAVKVLSESDPAERRRAMTYLEGLDPANVKEAARFQVAQALKERLDDQEPDIAQRAGPMLMKWSPSLAVDTFSLRMDRSTPEQRRQAITMLAELGDKNAIKAIAGRLADDTAAASAALIKFGKDAEPAVIDALDSDKPEMRRAAMDVLQTIGTRDCLAKIKTLAGDADVQVAGGARALWKKLDPDSFDPVTEAMFLIDSTVAAERAEGLNKLAAAEYDKDRAEAITPKVEQLLSDADESVAMAAAKAVGKYHRTDLAKDLAGWYDEPTDEPLKRKVALTAMGYMKQVDAVPQIIKWLAIDPQTAATSLIAMGSIAEQPLLAVMPARDDAAMLAACNVLEQIGTRRSLILLNSVAQMRANPEVRAAAKQARQAIIERMKAESATTP